MKIKRDMEEQEKKYIYIYQRGHLITIMITFCYLVIEEMYCSTDGTQSLLSLFLFFKRGLHYVVCYPWLRGRSDEKTD